MNIADKYTVQAGEIIVRPIKAAPPHECGGGKTDLLL